MLSTQKLLIGFLLQHLFKEQKKNTNVNDSISKCFRLLKTSFILNYSFENTCFS